MQQAPPIPLSRFALYFMEVARLGNLRKAAEVLHVSASAIDRQILQAEARFETRLFERLPTGLKLTSAGELLLADLRRWRKEHRRTLERFDDLHGLRRGHVSIALIDALSEGFVSRAIAELGTDYPGFTFDLQVLKNRQVSELVHSAEVDFGLLLEPDEHGHLEVMGEIDIPIGAVMPPRHPLAGERGIAFARILDERVLVPAAPLVVEERTRSLYTRHQMDGRRITTCNDIRMMRSLIRDGAGVGILSLIDVADDVREGRLSFVPLHGWQIAPLRLAVCTAPRRQPGRAAQLSMQHVIQAMQRLADAWRRDVPPPAEKPRRSAAPRRR